MLIPQYISEQDFDWIDNNFPMTDSIKQLRQFQNIFFFKFVVVQSNINYLLILIFMSQQ